MKKILLIMLVMILPLLSDARIKIVGYKDRNRKGYNELFRDANGDGKNDVTGKKYHHKFPFIDKNKDGINDVFIDKNGDGINDLKKSKYKYIDFNKDGINDITGIRYKKIKKTIRTSKVESYIDRGYDTFIDKNKNGIDDRREKVKKISIKKKPTGKKKVVKNKIEEKAKDKNKEEEKEKK